MTAEIVQHSAIAAWTYDGWVIMGDGITEESLKLVTKAHDGVIVGLFLDEYDAMQLYMNTVDRYGAPEKEEPRDYHITLCYLGKVDDLAEKRYVIESVLARFGVDYRGPIEGRIGGMGRFNTDEGDGTSALYATYDSPMLPHFRQRLLEALQNESGLDLAPKYGFIPHITLAYAPLEQEIPAFYINPQSLSFSALTLAWGDERIAIPLFPQLSVFKDHNGDWRWVAVSSTAFEDKDAEIVQKASLEADVARADRDGQYGPLLWWHDSSIELGQCDFNAMHGLSLIESGPIKNEAIGLALARIAPTLKMSIGFYERGLDQDRSYPYIRRVERSVLPAEKAANPYTAFFAIEEPMMISDKFKEFTDRVFGGDAQRAEAALAQAEAREKAALEAGVRYKEESAPATEAVAPVAAEAPVQPVLSIDAIAAAIAPAVAALVTPQLELVVKEALSNQQAFAQQQQATQKEQRDAEVLALKQSQAQLAQLIAGNEAKLKELLGEQPAASVGYRPSQDSSTVIGEDSTLKSAKAAHDPMDVHMTAILGALSAGG